jgi:hypothetical protein
MRVPIVPPPSSATPGLAAVRRSALTLAILAVSATGSLFPQAAVDPNVAPRAAALEREGERSLATEMLGRYLAVAPDDGRAWFHLGRFYWLDARDWHAAGHRGEPDGMLYLEFAVTALDQSTRLLVDSGVVYRGIVEMDRALLVVEDSGWVLARDRRTRGAAPEIPSFIAELGVNLLSSCPADGVLLTGTELETLAVWYAALEGHHRPDVLPLRPELYAVDPLYRRQMAAALGVDSALPVQRALSLAAARRPLCLTPGADSAAVPSAHWQAYRLARVSAPVPPAPDMLSLTELLAASRQGGSVWVADVRRVYDEAASRNSRLCGALVLFFGDSPPAACRP